MSLLSKTYTCKHCVYPLIVISFNSKPRYNKFYNFSPMLNPILFVTALFFLIYCLFFSATAFRLFTLTFSVALFVFTTHLLITTSTLTTLFSHYIVIHKFEFLGLSYALLLDCITLYFLLLTFLLFIICVLLA